MAKVPSSAARGIPPTPKPAVPKKDAVRVRVGDLVLPTYLPAAPDKNPMFLEKRVYQGSSGKVYSLPFTDRISEKLVDRKWKAVWIENEFLRVLVLPEIGGRIHRIQDKTTGCDLIYHQAVIKPALVGLAGPWISGGIEFNWPQHHRPATFLPVDFDIKKHTDGSKTVWCSDHDPICRMKGMHGVCLHPDRAYLELKVRVYNRTPLTQTFLWWANVATRVHEAYQSFFPPDVCYVADHARRSMSEYPLAKGCYYGVNYDERARKGVPESEVPSQFVPPHALKSDIRNSKSERNPKTEARNATGYDLQVSDFGLPSDFGSRISNLPDYRPNDLSFYANIPVPTSYMCMRSQGDFVGGYDYKSGVGIVHIANHHIAPGKKQWTWGNHEFGYAWDRNLTEKDANGAFAPYIEIMAGVYTDNQPDFSFLQPGETKTWSQHWYPIHKIGPAQHANLDAAVSLRVLDCGGRRSATPLFLGVSVTRRLPAARISLTAKSKQVYSAARDLSPGAPIVKEIKLPRGVIETDLLLRITDSNGKEIISYRPVPRSEGQVPPPASEPPAPEDISSNDELFLTGLHLEQYRHATRSPIIYWREALRRDPLDSRCNNAMGLWHFRRGEFASAEEHFRRAIERLTHRNANPYDGEAYYHLGLTLRHLGQDEEAYDALYKACWNQAWMSAGYHALAEMDCVRRNWATALDHLNRSLRFDSDNLRARNLKTIVLRELAGQAAAADVRRRKQTTTGSPPPHVSGYEREAANLLRETLALDPLDWWARQLNGDALDCDLQTCLDLAHDYARAGLYAEAIELLGARASARFNAANTEARGRGVNAALPDQNWGAWPLVHYTLGWLEQKRGNKVVALRHFKTAVRLPSDYCFPARLEEISILEAAMAANPRDAKAPYYMGNLFYGRHRHEEAIRLWERSAKLDPRFSIVWRNLGIGYFNILKQPARARAAYDRAFRANPKDARVLFERDQLWKRLSENPARRLRELERHPDLVQQRDDLSVELCALYNQAGQHEKALALVSSRNFQPWEGGEGGPLSQWVRSHLALGRRALVNSGARSPLRAEAPTRRSGARGVTRPTAAVEHFHAALTAPHNLGEAKHLLANQSDIHFWLGCAYDAAGETRLARKHWRAAATFKGDFQEMSVRTFSEMTYYSALSWKKLGKREKAARLLRDLLSHAKKLQKTEAKIDYFATSLPTMLLFDDDLQFRQETTALFLEAQAWLGLGQKAKAGKILATVLKRNPNHALAADLAAEWPVLSRP